MQFKERYSYRVLDRLLDLFENCKAFKCDDLKKNNIYIGEKDPLIQEYFRNRYKLQTYFDNELNLLSENSLIYIKYYEDDEVLQRVYLKLENIDKCYEFLNRNNKINEYKVLISDINNLKKNNKNEVCLSFLDECLVTLEKRKSYKEKFKNSEDLILILKGIEAIIDNKSDILIRNFSTKIFSDSKYLENHLNKFLNIFNNYFLMYFEDKDSFLNYFNIYKNPQYSYIKNGLKMKINDSIIDLDELGFEFSLTEEEIDKLEILSLSKKKILTIENLTTFHYFSLKDYVVIYLSGFSSSTKIKLLKKIHDFDNSISFFHFSDIDAGGFSIYFDLRSKLSVEITPYLMDVETLEKYIEFGKDLTEFDKKRLENILNFEFNPFKEVIKLMIKDNKKLEQESIDLKEFR